MMILFLKARVAGYTRSNPHGGSTYVREYTNRVQAKPKVAVTVPRATQDNLTEDLFSKRAPKRPDDNAQKPDTKPGDYYVTAVDGQRVARLLGPFRNNHAAALAMVDRVREHAYQLDPRSHWYAFGTARWDTDETKPVKTGVLNRHMGYRDGVLRHENDRGEAA